MKRVIFTVLAIFATLSSGLVAADEPVVVSTSSENKVRTTHNGFYMGLHGLYSVLKMDKDPICQGISSASVFEDIKGFSGGLFLGYGHVIGALYLGGEVSYAYGNLVSQKEGSGTALNPAPTSMSFKTKLTLNHLVDFSAHIGVPLNGGFLPYFLVGGRYENAKIQADARVIASGQSIDLGMGDEKNVLLPRLGLGLKWKNINSPIFFGVESGWSRVLGGQYDVKLRLGYQF